MATYSNAAALNTFVRVLLTKTPTKRAPPRYQLQNATAVKRLFDHLCAYCGERPQETLDHAIPINQQHLGEHVIGNLIPSCCICNEEKDKLNPPYGLDFREFLRRKEEGERLLKIETYMKDNGYTPLGDDTEIKALISTARADVVQALEKCVAGIKMRRN
jgi:hypothetical protein